MAVLAVAWPGAGWAGAAVSPQASGKANGVRAEMARGAPPTASTPLQKEKAKGTASHNGVGGAIGRENSPFAGLGLGNSHQPINIRSDTLALDYRDRKVEFEGHVRAIQADGELTSHTLTVLYGDNFHDIRQLIADGNVRISQGTRWATGSHAVLNEANHTMVLTGNPVVHDGSDQITGSRITVHLDTGKSIVDQARAVIFPRTQQTPDNGAGAEKAQR